MLGGESSSTANTLHSTPPWKYDVFLSFAGKDTRSNFTGHLYEAFIRSGITCFRDDLALEKGEDIYSLFEAIKDSLCAVLVISRNYAKSKWCLDELQNILDSQNTLGRRVFPIFYHVNPADVRHQRGSFGDAFAELEKKLTEDTTKEAQDSSWTSAEFVKKLKENETKVQNWRTALLTIGNKSGWVIEDEHEADLIKNIVGDVWRVLSTKLPSLHENLVGIDSKVVDVIPFLEIGSDGKRFVGIWGMGGVGKTTLARVVSEKLSNKFEICCFLEKVKDALSLPKGLVSLQKSFLSHLQIKDLKIYDSYDGMRKIRKLLCNKNVLLVLDDIDDTSQLEYLAKSPNWFGNGSRIIITTRDNHLLTSLEVESIYEMQTMNDDESLEIFSKKAFKKNCPEEAYLEDSKSVVKYAGGLPLALQALGSCLCGRKKNDGTWEAVLKILKELNPYKHILQVLKISYDGLNEKEQTIFLDIVCFFKHWVKNEVIEILEGCDLNPILGIKVLIEKTLLVETKFGLLDMHDLYEDLGWHIIQKKIPNRRLWKFGDIKEVLENNKGSGEIEAIVLEEKYWNKRWFFEQSIIVVHPEALSKMCGLRLLILQCRTTVPKGLENFSGALKYVRWPYFPLEALPFLLDELVHIEMPESNIKQLWNGKKSLNHLKFISLRASHKITEIPDFSNVQSLEYLGLSSCTSLVKVHESLGVLKELVKVDLRGCIKLNSLPRKLETNSLRMLDLGGCVEVNKLPEFGESMKKLSYLDASYTAITVLPESFGSLIGLRFLNLSATALVNLPTDCFNGLLGLVFLSLDGCVSLESLPRLPPHLTRLEANSCDSMKHSLDEHMLNLVTSLDHECRGLTKYVISDEEEETIPFPDDCDDEWILILKDVEPEDHPLRNFIASMPSGGEIPSWFEPNIDYYDNARYKCEIKVDVPPNFRASKWSGIVACLHISWGIRGMISWSSKAPEDDEYKGCAELPHGIWRLFAHDLFCVMVLEFNEETCWQHLRGDNNSLHIQFSSNPLSRHSDNHMYIWGCGWRVICKEDIQNQFTQPQHAPPSEVKLPFGELRRVTGFRPTFTLSSCR